MREIFLLLRYGVKGSSLVLSRRGGIAASVIPIAFSVLLFGLPIYYVERQMFSIAMPKEVFEILAGLWSLTMSLLVLSSLIPSILYAITGSDEKEMLAYMPLKASSLRWYLVTLSIATNPMMPIAYLMGLLGIFHGRGMGTTLAILNGISHVLFLIAVSSLISFLLSWKIRATRRLYIYSYVIGVILLVLVIQINPATAGNPMDMAKKIISMKDILTWKSSPFFWPVVYRPCRTFALAFLIFLLSDLVPSGEVERISRKSRKRFLGKDISLFLRKEQNLFFLAYPLIFSTLYGFFLKSDSVMYLIQITFAAFYSSVSAASLVQEELLVYPTSKLFPIETRRFLLSKYFTSLLSYVLASIVVLIVGAFLNGFSRVDALFLASLPVATHLSVSQGLLEALRNPDFSRGKVLSGRGFLKVEGIGVGFALLFFGVPSGILDPVFKIPGIFKIAIFSISLPLGIYLGILALQRAGDEFDSFEL